jgi:S-adenosylmethionine:tRNA ribosyltransferase-isomerase
VDGNKILMKTSDFNYYLPPELIAQTPLEKRDQSRLMILDRSAGKIKHSEFFKIPLVLKPGDCLVLNDSQVLPARLIGYRETGGAVEVLLLSGKGEGVWECMTRPGRKMKPGTYVVFGNGELSARVLESLPSGNRLMEFFYEGIFLEILEKLGRMPLPPYIKKELKDKSRYQTVYSKHPGSAAAPTAGLHFTKELMDELVGMGVEICYLTLHVGLGTFRPVKEEEVENHVMHAEYCVVSEETAKSVTAAKRSGRRVIACGTTSCRTLEALSEPDGTLREHSDWIDIFIYPGYRFKCVDGLITNFHLPESTLIMLVSAFAGTENIMRAYQEAVREKYRFFSFGDAMFIF